MVAKGLFEEFYNSVRKFTDIKSGDKVLDVGCGTGVYSLDIAKQGGVVTGIDLSPEAIDFANEWAAKEKLSFKGIVGDAEKLPSKEGTFDLVFFGAVLHHFPNCTQAIIEAKRVLKKRGRLVLVEPNGYNPALRISRFFARLLPVRYASEIHATKNETIHTPGKYLKILRSLNFRIIKTKFLKEKPAHKKTITRNLFLFTARLLKRVFMKLISYGPRQIGNEYFILLAIKEDD